MKKLFVVDGTGFLFRSYYAIRNMTNPKGESTNALFGFIRSLGKLRKDFSPDHLVVVFDGPNNSKSRKEIYPDYKANRKAAPEDLPLQMEWARDYCKLAGIPMLSIPEVEADDTMGSIARWAEKELAEVYICTSDKDMCQLVSDKVSILNIHKENLILDSAKVEETFGVPPSLIIDLLAISGDSSDNIPGVRGFGIKTAVKLLKEFGSLEAILENIDKVPGKKKQETLREDCALARLSQKLVTIDLEVNFPKEEQFFTLTSPPEDPLKDFFQMHNFTSLLRDFGNGAPSKDSTSLSYHLVDDEDSLKELLDKLRGAQEVCFDTETTSSRPMAAELVGIGFGIKASEAWYVPTNGNLGLNRVVEAFKPLFEDPSIGFYAHNIKYDLHVLRNYDITIKNISFDTILASYLLHSHSHRHSLDHLSLQYFGKVKKPIKDLIGSGKNAITMSEVAIPEVQAYCCEDVDYTCRLKKLLQAELEERKLTKLLYDMELPLLKVLARMERHGIYCDIPFLEKMSKEFESQITILEGDIYQLAGEVFNINSPKQLSQILFEKLSIPPSKKKNTGHSTSADVLENLLPNYPIAGKILEYRSLQKLRSTYIDALPQQVNTKTDRIHCSFNQFVTATGRLSCQDPNLQNIPVRTDAGKKIREAFRPNRKGWSFLAADYSQIELRLLAHLSEDPKLLEAFNKDDDIHRYTASLMFEIPQDQVTKEQRYHAKAVNFGIIYGQQAFGLARELQISVKEAADFIKRYFDRYPKVKNFTEKCIKKARENGKAVTLTGRERELPDINSKNGALRAAAERLAVNTPLQGANADLIKLAMIEIDKRLRDEQKVGFMMLQIHDELIFEVPDFELLDFEPIVRECMSQVFSLKVPLKVDIIIGKNWKEC